MAKDSRTRNFMTIVYPDSVNTPENWISILSDECIPMFISPLHDKDTEDDMEKTPKKPHHHVMMMFEGKKSDEQAKAIFDLVGGVGLKHVNSVRGSARYFCHLDSYDKAQYEVNDVICLSGADYLNTIGLPIDKYNAIGDMITFCKENDVYSYSEFLIYCMNNRPDWFKSLCDSSTYVIREFLKSRHWDATQGSEFLTYIDEILPLDPKEIKNE